MGLLTRAVRSPFLVRRLLTELRGIRRALERQADVLELQAQVGPRSGQTFRGFSREKTPSEGKGSSVSYVNPEEQAELLQRVEELTALLGRSPTDAELEMAFRGDVEPEDIPR